MEKLERKSHSWRHLLHEDLKRENRVAVVNTGLFDSEKLIEDPGDLFSAPVWEWLDDRPKSDIIESCKNLAIGSNTSSVMLSLRAVEDCLRTWYSEQMGKEISDVAWGRVLDELMQEFWQEEKQNDTLLTQLSDFPPVLTNLYYLKEKRNEVNHPDQSPNAQEARRTLLSVVSTISDIYDELKPDTGESKESISITLPDQVEDEEQFLYESIQNVKQELDGEAVPRELVFDIGEQVGMNDEEVNEVLQELLMGGKIYEPDQRHFNPI